MKIQFVKSRELQRSLGWMGHLEVIWSRLDLNWGIWGHRSSVMNISREGGFSASLGDLFQCLSLFFLDPDGISLNHLVPVAACVVTVHPCKQSNSVSSITTCISLGWTSPVLSPILQARFSNTLLMLVALHYTIPNLSMPLLSWGNWSWTHYSSHGSASGIILMILQL